MPAMNTLVRTVLAAGALAGVASADVCTDADLAAFGFAALAKTEGTTDAQGNAINCGGELAQAFADSSKFELDVLCRCIATLIANGGMDDLPDCDIEQFADVVVPGVTLPANGINLKSSYSDLCQVAPPPAGGPTEVGEGEECNGSVAPEFQTICGDGFECKMPVTDELVVGASGVCTKVAGTGGQGPTSGGDDGCTSDSDCKDGKKCGKINKKCVVPGSGTGGGNQGGNQDNNGEGGAQTEEESEEPSDAESTNSMNSTTTVATAESGAAGIEAAAVAAAAVVGFLGAL